MSLFRLIIYVAIAYLVLRFVRRLLSGPDAGSRLGSNFGSRVRPGSRSGHMIRCDSCGMFVTESSALQLSGSNYCSRRCAEGNLRKA
jgi:hypothetical protein